MKQIICLQKANKIVAISSLLIVIFFLINPFPFSTAKHTDLSFSKHIQNNNRLIETVSSNESYDYIIITSNELESTISFFKNWKEIIGYSVKIVNISWICSSYEGYDVAEKIKNFLISNYQNWNIRYVLFVGNGEIIPWRYCYEPQNENLAIPTDYYYADLSGDWDSNNNNIYGEFREDEWPDFSPEIYIGRIPVNEKEILNQIFRRIISYEQDKNSWKKNVLLLGAITNFDNEIGSGHKKTDTAELMEILKEDFFDTHGFPTTTLYEKDGISPSEFNADASLTAEHVQKELQNNDFGIITWGSHGSPTLAIRKWWEDDSNLNNLPDFNELGSESFFTRMNAFKLSENHPPFVFSCSCSNANPENPDNLGATLIKYGSVGFVGSTHYSYYTYGWNDQDDGGTMSVTYYFFKNFILENKSIGESLYESVYYCWEHNEITLIDPNIYVFTIYGDPSLGIESYPSLSLPSVPEKPSGAESLKPDVSYSFSTVSEDANQGQLYYIWDFGDGTVTSPLGPFNSGHKMSINHTYKIPGNYRVKVKGVNIIGDETLWSDPKLVSVSGPVIRVDQISGGLFKVNAVITNIGDQDANHIDWSISLQGGIILFGKQSSGSVSTLPAGEKTTIISKTIYGIGFPSVVMVNAGISDGSSDVEVQSAEIILALIRI